MSSNGLENPAPPRPALRALRQAERSAVEGSVAGERSEWLYAESGGHPGCRAVASSGLAERPMLIANRGLAELTNVATH
jgi:hypothetical protein